MSDYPLRRSFVAGSADELAAQLPEGPPGLQAPGPSTTEYIFWLFLSCAVIILPVLAARSTGVAPMALGFAGIVLMGLTLWRPEFGLLVLAALIPWEQFTVLSQGGWTGIRLVGYIVAGLAAPRLLLRGPKAPVMVKSATLLVVVAFFGSIIHMSHPSTIQYIALVSDFILLYLVMRFCSTPAIWYALVVVLVLSTAAETFVVFRIYDVVMGRIAQEDVLAVGTYVKSMLAAIFLIPVLMARTRSQVIRLVLVFAMVLCILAVVLTGSRAGVIGLGVGVVVFIVTLKGIPLRSKLLVLLIISAVAAMALFLTFRLGAERMWHERIQEFGAAAQARFERWQVGLQIASENLIFGTGMGNEPWEFARHGYFFTETHNDVLSALIRTGILGLLCYLGTLIFCLVSLWRLPRGVIRSSLLAVWLAILTYGTSQPSLAQKIFWLVAGICAAAIVAFQRTPGPVAPAQSQAGGLGPPAAPRPRHAEA
jgi:hypothetical protein